MYEAAVPPTELIAGINSRRAPQSCVSQNNTWIPWGVFSLSSVLLLDKAPSLTNSCSSTQFAHNTAREVRAPCYLPSAAAALLSGSASRNIWIESFVAGCASCSACRFTLWACRGLASFQPPSTRVYIGPNHSMLQRVSPTKVREATQRLTLLSFCSFDRRTSPNALLSSGDNRVRTDLELCAWVSKTFAELNTIVHDKVFRYLRLQPQGRRAPSCVQKLQKTISSSRCT